MSVSVNRKALRDFIKSALFEREDVRYGTFDRPLKSEQEDNETEFETTVPSEVPVAPVKMMATQLADDRPPVEDEDFVPANSEELARSASVLASMVPHGQVEKFYHELHRLLDVATADENDPGDIESSNMDIPIDTEQSVQEEAIRRAVRSVIFEAYGHQTPWDDIEFAQSDDDYLSDDNETAQEWSAGDEEATPTGSDEMGFDELATAGGYSSASGARQDIERILSRMKYLGTEIPAGHLEKLQEFGTSEFIDVMLANGYLDDSDAVELQQAPAAVRDLDSFRTFFVTAILMPAYNEVKRTARKKVEAEIEKLGLPKKSKQTVLNQALGETPRSPKKLSNKIIKDFLGQKLGSEDQAQALAVKVNDEMLNLQNLQVYHLYF